MVKAQVEAGLCAAVQVAAVPNKLKSAKRIIDEETSRWGLPQPWPCALESCSHGLPGRSRCSSALSRGKHPLSPELESNSTSYRRPRTQTSPTCLPISGQVI